MTPIKQDLSGPVESIGFYDSLIRQAPGVAAHYFDRGRAYQRSQYFGNPELSENNLRSAIEDYTRTLEIDPKFLLAYFKRAQVKRWLHDVPAAISDLEVAISIDPQFAIATMFLAYLFATDPDACNRNGERAVLLAEKALDLAPQDFRRDALETMAASCAEVGDFKAAIYWQEKAIHEFPLEEEFLIDGLELYKKSCPFREI